MARRFHSKEIAQMSILPREDDVFFCRQCGQVNLLLLIFAAAHKLSSIV